MDKRTFIEAYCISAIQGSAIERGSITPEDVIAEALAMWIMIEEAEPRFPPRGARAKVKEEQEQD